VLRAEGAGGGSCSDIGVVVAAGGGVLERDGVSAADSREAVVAGGKGGVSGLVIGLVHRAGERCGEGLGVYLAHRAIDCCGGQDIVARAAAPEREPGNGDRLARADIGIVTGARSRIVEGDTVCVIDVT
jgi:hypothetical protein